MLSNIAPVKLNIKHIMDASHKQILLYIYSQVL